MRKPIATGQFRKDVKRIQRRSKDTEKLRAVLDDLIAGRPLSPRLKDHKLKGQWGGRRECHVEPDWLLIYQLPDDDTVIFERTGTHADLFEL